MYYGIEKDSSPGAHSLCFIRTVDNIDLQHKKAWRFIDQKADRSVDEETMTRLDKLKNRVCEILPASNVYRYVES